MSFAKLLFRTLLHYARTNVAVLLGVAAATTVLTGALVVGDSVRGSLRDLTLRRLGAIDHAVVSERFFRTELAEEVAADAQFATSFERMAPALLAAGNVEGTAARPGEPVGRAYGVNVIGVTAEFGEFFLRTESSARDASLGPPAELMEIGAREVVLNAALAEELGRRGEPVAAGQRVRIRMERAGGISADALMADRRETFGELVLTVAAVLDAEEPAGRFSLVPNQRRPRNAYVAIETLQQELDLEGRANVLVAAESSDASGSAEERAGRLTELVARHWRLGDLELELIARVLPAGSGTRSVRAARSHAERGNEEVRDYLVLESRRRILEPLLADAAMEAAEDVGVRSAPTLTYLANTIAPSRAVERGQGEGGRDVPYSTVTALDPSLDSPLGPLYLMDGSPAPPLGAGEIYLSDWLVDPALDNLRVEVGDRVQLDYFVVGPRGELSTDSATFRVAGIVDHTRGLGADATLTPEYPGITDADVMSEWDESILPIDTRRIRPIDEAYWNEHGALPKAFVSLEDGRRLWGSRYGDLTAIRLAPVGAASRRVPSGTAEGEDAETRGRGGAETHEGGDAGRRGLGDGETYATAEVFERWLLARLEPDDVGLVFRAIKHEGLEASQGATDFSALFLSFSFFLIASAVLLTALLFRLGVEQRAQQIGLLAAQGFPAGRLRRLVMGEGAIVSAAGVVVGVVGAVGYAAAMLGALRSRWSGAVGDMPLALHVGAASLVIGLVASAAGAGLAMYVSVRRLLKVPPRALLAGSLGMETGGTRQRGALSPRCSSLAVPLVVFSGSLALAAALLVLGRVGLVAETGAFFGVGGSMLVAALAGLVLWLKSDRSAAVRGRGTWAVAKLGVRNGARQPARSVLTAGLVAAATFVLVTVAAFRRDPAAEAPEYDSGNGGFSLIAESAAPILLDLNDPEARQRLGLTPTGEAPVPVLRLLAAARFVPFRVRPGEDASCLNLYQAARPRVLGVPPEMIERGGFAFEGDAGWHLLTEPRDDGTIPALADANTVRWMLHKGVGDVIEIPRDGGGNARLRIVGLFSGSIFQGDMLISEANFETNFPLESGFRYFLIELPTRAHLLSRSERSVGARGSDGAGRSDAADALAALLEDELSDYGFDVQTSGERLAELLAVQNTYLSTFATLGGLGLLLGTLGLATVILRGVLERRGELALLGALGFRRFQIGWLVMSENAFLLLLGLVVGALSALVAVAPQLGRAGSDVNWAELVTMLALVLVFGVAAGLFAVVAALRMPLLAALRSD